MEQYWRYYCHYHCQLSKGRLAITWLQSPLQRPQWLIKNIALLHCFYRLLMKMSPTVIEAGKLSTTAPQICSVNHEEEHKEPQQRTKEEGGVRSKPICQAVSWSTTLVQTEISQQLQNGLPLNFVQTFMVPRGWIFLTLVIPLEHHHEFDIYSFDWNILTTIGWIAIKKICHRHSCSPQDDF